MNKTRVINERPFYFANILADPIDTNRVYKPGFRLTVSKNGGKNFGSTSVTGGAYHPDLHALYIGKKDNKLLYLGTDGGFYVSRAQGNTWSMSRSLAISQFYHVSADMETPYKVYGGLQNNGSWFGLSKSPGGITNADWKGVGFGDGFCVHADPKDNNIVFWQYQGGNIARAYLKTNEFKAIKPYKSNKANDLRFNWNTPVVFSFDGNRMYVGAQYLYVTENRGDTWKRISPDLTTNDPNKQKQEESGGLTIDNSTAENHCTIFAISESSLDKNIIWTGNMNDLHKKLVATKEGNITREEQLREKIATLYGYVLFFKGKPTDSQIARINDLEKEVNLVNQQLQKTIQTEVEKLNKLIIKAGGKLIKLISKEEYLKEK